MPFINESSKRETMQRFMPYEHVPESSWSETFAASLGQVFDEELSVSRMLNREGFETRNRLIDERIKAGEIDPTPFKTRGGRARLIDYGKIAERLQDPDIKTDSQLNEERNALLAQRREYAQNVLSTGPGLAQFAGAATGYVLDPVNIATMGVSGPVAGAKAATVIGRALQYGRNAAIISGGTEIGIQALVYGHKQDIGSPYDASDALANIGMAATGALVLGSIQGGISAWLDGVLKQADPVPQTKDVVAAKEYLTRMKRSLENSPPVEDVEYKPKLAEKPVRLDLLELKKTLLQEAREELTPIAGNKLGRGEVKQLTYEKKDIEYKLSQLQEPTTKEVDAYIEKLKAESPKEKARPRKAKARELAAGDYHEEKGALEERLAIIDRQLQSNELANNAASDLARLDQGVMPDKYLRLMDKVISEHQIKSDIQYLQEGVARSEQYAKPSKEPEHYPVPERPKAAGQTVTDRERDILTRHGIAEDYDADMQAFRQLENPMIMDGEDMIDAKSVIDEIDKELDGLDSVLRCAYG